MSSINPILLAVLFVITVIFILYLNRTRSKPSADCTATFPCPQDKTPGGLKLVQVKDIEPALLERAVKEFTEGYELDRMPEIQHEAGVSFVTADSGMPYMTFCFLVNALRYCDKSRKYDVTGWYDMQLNREDGDGLNLSHQTLMMYIPEEDNEYDNVFFVAPDGRFFKQPFSGHCTLELLSRDHRPYQAADGTAQE